MENGIFISGFAWVTLIAELVFAGACVYVASVARKRGIVASAAWLLACGAGLMVLFDCVGTAGGTVANFSESSVDASAVVFLLANVVSIVAFIAIGVSFLLFKPTRGGTHGR